MAKTDIFNFENAVKFGGFLVTNTVGLCALYFALKSDVRNTNTEKKFQVEHLQYQIDELRNCCEGKGTEKRFAFKQTPAILPHEIELEKEQ